MHIYMVPLISGEALFALCGLVCIFVVGIATYDPAEESPWRARVPPNVVRGACVAFAAVLTGFQMDQMAMHFRARRMDCERTTGTIETRVRNGRNPTIELVVADRTFVVARNSSDTSRLVSRIEASGRSRRYVVCSDEAGKILRVDRAPR